MAGLLEQKSGKLEVSKSGLDWAFLQKEEDLKLRGHYIVRWKWKVTGPSANIFAFAGISGSKLTAGEARGGTFFGDGGAGQSMFYMFPLLGSGEVGHVNIVQIYRNTSGILVTVKVSVSTSAWPQALEVIDELEYDGTSIHYRSDINGVTGFTPLQRNTSVVIAGTVKDFPKHHFLFPLPHTDTGSGMKVFADDVQVITVPPP